MVNVLVKTVMLRSLSLSLASLIFLYIWVIVDIEHTSLSVYIERKTQELFWVHSWIYELDV